MCGLATQDTIKIQSEIQNVRNLLEKSIEEMNNSPVRLMIQNGHEEYVKKDTELVEALRGYIKNQLKRIENINEGTQNVEVFNPSNILINDIR